MAEHGAEGFFPLVRKNLQHYGKKALVAARDLSASVALPHLRQPIFIVGCSRAGTTLIYKTFSESKELGSLQKETHGFWAAMHPLQERNWDTHAIAESSACDADREHVERYFYIHTGKSRVVDKNNQNGLSIPYLSRLFPDAHFVFIKRSPGDNINSLIHGWGKADEFAAWSMDLPESVEVEDGKYRRWCFFLSEGWRNYLRSPIEDVCAFQYISMNEAILEARSMIPQDRWHEIRYEELIMDPVKGFRCLFESCALDFDSHLQRHCSEVISKPYNAFSEIRVDKWKDGANRERIERILPAVGEVAKKLGYPP